MGRRGGGEGRGRRCVCVCVCVCARARAPAARLGQTRLARFRILRLARARVSDVWAVCARAGRGAAAPAGAVLPARDGADPAGPRRPRARHRAQHAGHDPPPHTHSVSNMPITTPYTHTLSNMPITTPHPHVAAGSHDACRSPMHIAPRRRAARLGRPRMHGPPQAPAARDQGRVAWAAWQALKVAMLESHARCIQLARATVAGAGSR